ncbi:MAG: hypothetical protein DMF87_24765 [Acidobacteria bacterium]|nr:MAG: hypothetical protein DMF87_24765 [Acidobacteriota bacterium]
MPVLPSSDMPSHFPNVFTGCHEPLNQGGKPLPGAKPRTPNHNYQLRTTNYQPPTTNHQPPTTNQTGPPTVPSPRCSARPRLRRA